MSASKEALPPFVNKWRESYPDYASPYGVSRRLSEGNSTDGGRMLQGGARAMGESI